MSEVLCTMRGVIAEELSDQLSRGQKLKNAFHAIARAFVGVGAKCISPRRVRAFHHNEVAEDDVRAKEWLAALELRTKRRKARIAAARALLAEEEQ